MAKLPNRAHRRLDVPHLVASIRLRALLSAFERVYSEDVSLTVEFETFAGKEGWLLETDGSEETYVLLWNHDGIVGLCYSKLEDFDDQGPKAARGESTPEIYLRFPERCLRPGPKVPVELEQLAIEAEERIGRVATAGFWATGTGSSVPVDGFDGQRAFEPFTFSARDAAFGCTREDGSHWQGWGAPFFARPELIELAIRLATSPWRPLAELSRQDERLLLECYGREHAERNYRQSTARGAAKLLAKLGVDWDPPRKLRVYKA